VTMSHTGRLAAAIGPVVFRRAVERRVRESEERRRVDSEASNGCDAILLCLVTLQFFARLYLSDR
jgi:hypothetical protein